jgi:hypothetical protein
MCQQQREEQFDEGLHIIVQSQSLALFCASRAVERIDHFEEFAARFLVANSGNTASDGASDCGLWKQAMESITFAVDNSVLFGHGVYFLAT